MSSSQRGALLAFGALGCRLLAASPAAAQAAAVIAVGPTVQVSAAHPRDAHFEVLAAADPHDPKRLLVGSFRFPTGTSSSGTVVYVSRDGGRSWRPTLDGAPLANTSDPAPAFGPDGHAYYTASSLGPPGTPRDARRMLLFRSADGGLTWSAPTPFTYSDRQYITVDGTDGRFRGRLYVNGNNRVPYGISDFVVFRSTDHGATWQGPATRPGFGTHSAGTMGNAVIASDGTLIGLFEEGGALEAITSTDGGGSLTPAVMIDSTYVAPGDRKGARNNVTALPFASIDASPGPYRDRVYAVWADRRGGHSRIYLALSSDKGATWSAARRIDDTPERDSVDNFMPTVAVNRDGAVAVMWYDRRTHPDNLGWDVRVTASVDGGQSFAPSVQVSEHGSTFEPTTPFATLRATVARPKSGATDGGLTLDLSLNNFTFLGGDTNGLAADAAGTFHAVWVDNHTGTPQVWTAPVRVTSGTLAANETDVSNLLTLDVDDAALDPASHSVHATVRLHNMSRETVRGPFVVYLRSARSALFGSVSTPVVRWMVPDASLPAGARSRALTWRFAVADPKPFRAGDRYQLGLLELHVVIATRRSTAPSASPSR